MENNLFIIDDKVNLKENKENLDKTNILFQFSDVKPEKSLLYTEIKKSKENKLNFKVKNVDNNNEFKTKRKKF